MRFLCFFMASGHTKANYIEIVCHVSTYKNNLSYQEFVHSYRVSCSPQSLRSDIQREQGMSYCWKMVH